MPPYSKKQKKKRKKTSCLKEGPGGRIGTIHKLCYSSEQTSFAFNPTSTFAQFPISHNFVKHIRTQPICTTNRQAGFSISDSSSNDSNSQHNTHKVFLFCNYILIGAASSCIFLNSLLEY